MMTWRLACFALAFATALIVGVSFANAVNIFRNVPFDSCLGVAVCVLSWGSTGRSPFWWGAVAMLHLETIRVQFGASAAFAVRHFADNYAGAFARLKREVLDV